MSVFVFKEHIQSCSQRSVLGNRWQSFDNGPHNAVPFSAQFEVKILVNCININFCQSFLGYLTRVLLSVVTFKTKLQESYFPEKISR